MVIRFFHSPCTWEATITNWTFNWIRQKDGKKYEELHGKIIKFERYICNLVACINMSRFSCKRVFLTLYYTYIEIWFFLPPIFFLKRRYARTCYYYVYNLIDARLTSLGKVNNTLWICSKQSFDSWKDREATKKSQRLRTRLVGQHTAISLIRIAHELVINRFRIFSLTHPLLGSRFRWN